MVESNFEPKKKITPLNVFLQEKYKRDSEKDLYGKLKGYSLWHYKDLSAAIDGWQYGMHCIVARSNVGKTSLLLSLACDLLLCPQNEVSIVIYTLDDNKEEAINYVLSFLCDLPRNIVDRKRYKPEDEQIVKMGYEKLEMLSKDGRLDILDFSEVSKWSDILSDIRRRKQESPNLCVFIDGFSHAEYSEIPERKAWNAQKSLDLKQLAAELLIPITITCEVPKSATYRPKKEDIMESVRFSFDCRLCLCLSAINNEAYKTGSFPTIVIEFDKNKLSSFKGSLFALFKSSRSRFEILPEEEYKELYKVKEKFDKEIGKAK